MSSDKAVNLDLKLFKKKVENMQILMLVNSTALRALQNKLGKNMLQLHWQHSTKEHHNFPQTLLLK